MSLRNKQARGILVSDLQNNKISKKLIQWEGILFLQMRELKKITNESGRYFRFIVRLFCKSSPWESFEWDPWQL